MYRRSLMWVGAIFVVACGPGNTGAVSESTTPVAEAPEVSGSETPPESEAPVDPRRLAAGATYADLVAAAGALDARGGDRSPSGCLLAQSGAGHVLRADVAIALRPVPTPPAQITTAGTSVRVFSRWGQRGSGSPVLAALTATPPPAGGPALAVLIGEESLTLRSTDGVLQENDVATPALSEALREALARGASRVFVSANGNVSLTRLREVLAALPADAADLVVLAVALSSDTTLPDPPPRGTGDTGMCATMPPRTPGPTGDMDPAAARAALAGLSAASECLSNAGPESAAGGRLGIELIVGPSGSVERACTTSDEIGDSGVRTCVLDHVRAIRFPASSGEVTLRLPIMLVPDRSEAPRALCP